MEEHERIEIRRMPEALWLGVVEGSTDLMILECFLEETSRGAGGRLVVDDEDESFEEGLLEQFEAKEQSL